MNFGSLFAGIGGIDLGLERAGMECAWQVEIDDYCLEVLEIIWPDVPKYRDVRDVGKQNLEAVDLIVGGFPCQPHSVAGEQRGAKDNRNLWPEFSRVIAELQPRYVLAENVPGIITTYIDTVLSDLESQAYTTATFNIPACAFDAPHRRERIFIVAYSNNKRKLQSSRSKQTQRERISNSGEKGFLADTRRESARSKKTRTGKQKQKNSNAKIIGTNAGYRSTNSGQVGRTYWSIEPNVGRVADGIPARVDRLRALGNAVVPQVAEWIGKRILEYDKIKS